MDINLKGKRAIVCGASKGMGQATAIELASLGASVTLVARRAEVLEQVRASLDVSKGQKHHALAADFFEITGLREKMVAHVASHGPFHILVNNAGGPPPGPAHTAHAKDFERIFTQHLLASHTMLQAVVEGMKAEKYGRIIRQKINRHKNGD